MEEEGAARCGVAVGRESGGRRRGNGGGLGGFLKIFAFSGQGFGCNAGRCCVANRKFNARLEGRKMGMRLEGPSRLRVNKIAAPPVVASQGRAEGGVKPPLHLPGERDGISIWLIGFIDYGGAGV